TVRLVNRRAPLMAVGFARMERRHPRAPHFYLPTLGVAPEAQGRGLGSALLAPMLERCDVEGVGAYLESSKERNVAFYGRHGFRVVDEMTFPRGPRLWLMWRDPR
ncbi:MAG: GNAT family N-acetyltransferase, partial [Actinomycetota bacterium]|nr:GNAT family N-acetyltransferase [Actinomycetota bacterium]